MATSRFDDAVVALLAAFAGAAGLTGVTVYDGAAPTAAATLDYVIVGHDGTTDANGALSGLTSAGAITQTWMDMPGVKEEAGVIHCVAVSQVGDAADLPARRARAQALLEACGTAAIAANVTSGILFEGTETADVHYLQDTAGVAVMITFAIGYSSPW